MQALVPQGEAKRSNMDPDDKIFVQIDDLGGATKAVWLEELAHARQFMIYGSIDASADWSDRCEREIEVHECLLKNAKRLKLTPQEISDCKRQLDFYRGV